MGGANMGRSNEEEVDPPEELHHTTAIAHTIQSREAHIPIQKSLMYLDTF
jgi:hypothetical protein